MAMASDSENRNTNSSCKAEGLELSSFLYSTANEGEVLRREKWFPVNFLGRAGKDICFAKIVREHNVQCV